MLNWCIRKVNEVAQDLREPQDGANLGHQADKLDKVCEELRALIERLANVHGVRSGLISSLSCEEWL